MSRCIRSQDMTCHQNSLSAHYAQYMFKVNDDCSTAYQLGLVALLIYDSSTA